MIVYAPPSENPLIGHNAPSLDDVSEGKKRKPSSTKASTRKPPPQVIPAQQTPLHITRPSADTTNQQIMNIPSSAPGNQSASCMYKNNIYISALIVKSNY